MPATTKQPTRDSCSIGFSTMVLVCGGRREASTKTKVVRESGKKGGGEMARGCEREVTG